MLIEPAKAAPDVERELRRLQLSPEERERRYPGARPFDLEAWLRETPPASPEQLEEMEEFLRQRRLDRDLDAARDAEISL